MDRVRRGVGGQLKASIGGSKRNASNCRVREIRRLLDEGDLSQRDVAVRLGVSRGTVWRIASGRRGLHGGGEVIQFVKKEATQSLPTRCPGCGGKVYLPCRLCRTRAFARRVA